MRCSVCGSPRGQQRYCWNCKAEMPPLTDEEYLNSDTSRKIILNDGGLVDDGEEHR